MHLDNAFVLDAEQDNHTGFFRVPFINPNFCLGMKANGRHKIDCSSCYGFVRWDMKA